MAGALTERAFVTHLERAGFTDLQVLRRDPYGVDDLDGTPPITPELIDLMRRLLPPATQREIGRLLVVTAVRP